MFLDNYREFLEIVPRISYIRLMKSDVQQQKLAKTLIIVIVYGATDFFSFFLKCDPRFPGFFLCWLRWHGPTAANGQAAHRLATACFLLTCLMVCAWTAGISCRRMKLELDELC